MIKIVNSAETFKIDIIGEIGDGFFTEGYSKANITDDIAKANGMDIEINLSSLGGNVDDALYIYDTLKSYKGRITAHLKGMNASAATIIAMGADEIIMSENAHFLIHTVWTMVAGNSEVMRDTADDLDRFDDVLARIYSKKTGKTKSKMLSFMKEKRGEGQWLSAKEAKEWGFVDKISSPLKIAASVYQSINQSNLPKINPNMGENEKEVVLNEDKITEKILNGMKALMPSFLNTAKPEKEAKEKEAKEKEEDVDAKIQASLEKVKADLDTKFQANVEALQAIVSEKEKDLAEKEAEIERLKAATSSPKPNASEKENAGEGNGNEIPPIYQAMYYDAIKQYIK